MYKNIFHKLFLKLLHLRTEKIMSKGRIRKPKKMKAVNITTTFHPIDIEKHGNVDNMREAIYNTHKVEYNNRDKRKGLICEYEQSNGLKFKTK